MCHSSVRCITASAASPAELELLRPGPALGDTEAALLAATFCVPLAVVPFCMCPLAACGSWTGAAAAAAEARTGPPRKCRWFRASSGKRTGETGRLSGTCVWPN